MGGNALSTKGVRLSAADYRAVSILVKRKLQRGFPEIEFQQPPSYTEKESFGDLDLIMCLEEDDPDSPVKPSWEEIAQALGAKEFKVNGGTCSFGIPLDMGATPLTEGTHFQVDITAIYGTSECDYGEHSFAYRYFSFNDAWGIVGAVAKSLGLSFGHTGLKYKLRHPMLRGGRDLTVTVDFSAALRILGYANTTTTPYRSFRNMEEVFEYVTSSPHFHPKLVRLENLASDVRNRNKRRVNYQLFLGWLEENADRWCPDEEFTPDSQSGLSMLLREYHRGYSSHLAGRDYDLFVKQYRAAMEEISQEESFRAALNGELIQQVAMGQAPGLSQKAGQIGVSKEVSGEAIGRLKTSLVKTLGKGTVVSLSQKGVLCDLVRLNLFLQGALD